MNNGCIFSGNKTVELPLFVKNALQFMDSIKGQVGTDVQDIMSDNLPNVIMDLNSN